MGARDLPLLAASQQRARKFIKIVSERRQADSRARQFLLLGSCRSLVTGA